MALFPFTGTEAPNLVHHLYWATVSECAP